MTRGRPADKDPLWAKFMDAVKLHVEAPSQETHDVVLAAWREWDQSFKGTGTWTDQAETTTR